MATIKRGYYGLKTLLASLLAIFAGAAPGSADTDALVSRLSDSDSYDTLLLARTTDDEAMSVPPEPVRPAAQPAQALKLKPGEQPRQTFEAWPAGRQPQQAAKIAPQPQQAAKIAPQPQQALKLKPGEQPQQALKLKPQQEQ